MSPLPLVKQYYRLCDRLPQWSLPSPLLNLLAKTLPDSCPFETVWKLPGTNIIVVYIPSLCCLNPFYNAIMLRKMEILSENE